MRGNGSARSCLVACGALAALGILAVVAVLGVGAWYLYRDGPEAAVERLPVGDERVYLTVRLRPDDEGMRRLALALFEAGQDAVFAQTAAPGWLKSSRQEGWLALLPATFEWALPEGGEGVLRVRFEGNHTAARALFRILRWAASATNRIPGAPSALDLAGPLPAVRLPVEGGGSIVVAFAGNRLLAARSEGAIERTLTTETLPVERPPSVRFEREDGWGWLFHGGARVHYSLRVDSDDVLRFRALVPVSDCAPVHEEAMGIVAAAGLEWADGPSVSPHGDGGACLVTGAVAGVRERALRAIPEVKVVGAGQG